MKIHLTGGFLGSGKTTAIANAAKLLMKGNVKTGVITNDQGKYLVDSKFISLSEITGAEVNGGCFCCNYDALDEQIDFLKNEINPSVIFAESVGSCTDLIATVVRPMAKLRDDDVDVITFSGFADSRMLLEYLQGEPLPFTKETNYIWLKQIEEAEILVINKIDLLSNEDLHALKDLAYQKFSSKKLLFQNSLDMNSIKEWVKLLEACKPEGEHRVIDVDYEIYGKGEAQLAWLDEEIEFKSREMKAVKTALRFIEGVAAKTQSLHLPIGHLKFLLSTPSESHKISFTTVINKDWKESFHIQDSDYAHLMVNARVQSSPEELRQIITEAAREIEAGFSSHLDERNVSYFKPGMPKPTHRFAG